MRGAGGGLAIEDADFVIDQLDVGDVRVDLRERFAGGGVERVHGAVTFGGGVVEFAIDGDLDHGLGEHFVEPAPALDERRRSTMTKSSSSKGAL